LLVISALFLADALRRLRREFSRNRKFVQNSKTMCLHVFVIIGHVFVLVFTQYTLARNLKDPSPMSKTIV
jgi:hypothetical protein